VLLLMS
jgi:hypothetical protein